ncbi:MAG: hypothetical protein AAGB46_12935 [Verrucomicrobiota bacterium]
MLSKEAKYWTKKAKGVARLVNFFWWLEKSAPWWVLLNAVAICASLALKRWFGLGDAFWISYGALFIGLAVFGFFRARPKYIGEQKAMARLESELGLNSRLTAVQAGLSEWPVEKEVRMGTFSVSGSRMLSSLGASFVLLAVGALWPVSESVAKERRAVTDGPEAWSELESWLDLVESTELIQEEALDRFEDKLNELKDQPNEEWFSEGSMEASDFLVSQSQDATMSFLQALETASFAASRLNDGVGGRESKSQSKALDEALNELDLGTLPMREDLMKSLSELARNGQNQMDSEKMQELLDKMKDGAQACRTGMGLPPFKPRELKPEDLRPGGTGEGEEGPTPLTVTDSSSPLLEGNAEGISNEDRSRSILGDTAFTTSIKSEDFEPEYSGLEMGNRADNLGKGGEAIWNTRARPEEQEVLKRFFGNE